MGGVATALCRGVVGHAIDTGRLAMKTVRRAIATAFPAKSVKLCDHHQVVQGA